MHQYLTTTWKIHTLRKKDFARLFNMLSSYKARADYLSTKRKSVTRINKSTFWMIFLYIADQIIIDISKRMLIADYRKIMRLCAKLCVIDPLEYLSINQHPS